MSQNPTATSTDDDPIATIDPKPDAASCELDGCQRVKRIVKVVPHGEDNCRVLCPDHLVGHLEELNDE